jgi:hypothetical protein
MATATADEWWSVAARVDALEKELVATRTALVQVQVKLHVVGGVLARVFADAETATS